MERVYMEIIETQLYKPRKGKKLPHKRFVPKKRGKTQVKKKRRPKAKNKLKEADRDFANAIKDRDNWTCRRCGKYYPPETPKRTQLLTCSHFWGRARKSVRFDFENCVAICWMPCHKYHWEKEKQGEYRRFMLEWLGEEKYNALEARAHQTMLQSEAIRIFYESVDKSMDNL